MKWYRIEAKAEKAEIWIYEYIGEDFWTGGVTAKNFQKDLDAIKAKQIDLHINSPGGDVFDGVTIYNLLKQHPANVTTYIDGLAASIASVVALAGDKVYMAENALYMIHNPWGFAMGDANDMRKTADVLDKVRGSMMTTYVSASGKTEEEIIPLLDAETWMDAEEAKEFGFVDEITEKMDLAACSKFLPVMSKLKFKNVPQAFSGAKEMPAEKELERALRDVGCSRKAAKSILAKGYSDGLRDAGADDDAPPITEPLRDAEEPIPARKDSVTDLLVKATRLLAST
jgi:ATP-dependent Clp endopeptidase proteolytic subunit ClpP